MTLYLAGGAFDDALAPVLDAFCDDVRSRAGVVVLVTTDDQAPELCDALAARLPDTEIAPPPAEWPDEVAGVVVDDVLFANLESLLGPHREALGTQLRQGSSFLGCGAGARFAAKHAIVGGGRHQGRQVCAGSDDEIAVAQGLALVGIGVETGADTDFTLGRAIAALDLAPLRGVALIDRHAALHVNAVSGRTKTLGDGNVTWVDRVGADALIRRMNGGEHADSRR